MTGSFATAAAAIALALVHLSAGGLRFLDAMPRSRWLSAAGGVSVAYVFLHLLPELAERRAEGVAVYPFALAGLVAYYALERAVRVRRNGDESGDDRATADGIFRLHIASFALYNGVIGYTLAAEERESLVLFSMAMALHFVVSDHGLRHAHRRAYDRIGRWIVSGSVVAGWAIGSAFELPPAAATVALALLGGAIVLNVLKEELPEERQSRILPFAGGAAAYGALLVAL